MYNNHNSLNKQYCRDLVDKQVSRIKGRVNVFTLPSTNFILEKKLSKRKDVSLYCAENNPYIYKQQKKSNLPKGLVLKKGDVFDIINKSKQQFDVIWLDLCSPMRHTILNRCLSLVQSDSIKSGTYLNITFAGARDSGYEAMLNFYKAKNLEEFRSTIFPKLINQFANSVGRDCKLINTVNYKEQGHAIPMKMLTFKFK